MQTTKASPVTALNGCGKKRAELLQMIGINTVADLIRHFPRGYQNRGDVKEITESEIGNTGAFVLTVANPPSTVRLRGGKTLTKCRAFDGDKSCTLLFFNRNYLKEVLFTGQTYRFWGKLTKTKSGFELSPSVIEPITEVKALPDFIPVYPLTKGLTQNFIKNLIANALSSLTFNENDEMLPKSIREKLGVLSEEAALKCVHFPKNEDDIKIGRERFVLEELFVFACSVTLSKRGRTLYSAKHFDYEKCKLYDFTDKLPFTLTKAQARVISEIRKDLIGQYPMARMISGDVGSGKTACAMAAAYMAIKNGYQCAVMAPTEILAMQHFRDFTELFCRLGIECEYLTSSTPAAQKKSTLQRLQSGELKLVIGTHALISDKVEFNNLGLVITDEQHRFGVMQRARLQSKGLTPHVLVMSATPIPRSLALILLGDLDISVVDELPPGRQTVDTLVVNETHRERLYGFINKQVTLGRQVYIVCPTVENKDDEDETELVDFFTPFNEKLPKLKSAVDYAKILQNEIFPDFKIAFLHGKMKGREKDEIMAAFAAGDIDILVSTTVIEVGVNVPNATLMIVENAERFGLSQLHQLRGRVGRGSEKSYCVLVSDAKGENAQKRLSVLHEQSSGYEIARYDLEMRGPGDFISGTSGATKQHGAFTLKLAGLCTDTLVLDKVFKLAEELLAEDNILSNSEYLALSRAISTANNFSLNTKN